MTESQHVRSSVEDGVGRIRIDRPEARNALSLPVIQELHEAVRETAAADGLRVVILEGSDPCFCAGMDLKGCIHDPDSMAMMLHTLAETVIAIRSLEVPTIAKVQGAAIGGGCGLMVVCDLAFTHPEAKLGYPEVDLGVCPAVVAPLLIRRIGAGRARSMLLMGGTMSGSDGFETGLATHLVPREELDESVDRHVENLIKGGPEAIRATKKWLNEIESPELAESIKRGAEISAEIIRGEEAQERLKRLFSS